MLTFLGKSKIKIWKDKNMYFWNVFIQELLKQYVRILNNASVIIWSFIIK